MYERGTYFVKNAVKKGKGLDLGAEPPVQKFVKIPPPPHHPLRGDATNRIETIFPPEAESNVISFYRHPASLAASPGDHVIFTCAVEGSPAPSIIWLKDGLKVVDDKAKNYQGRESTISELHILDVQQHHAGNYACKAANAMGSGVSRNALLSLTGKPDSAKSKLY